MGLHRWLLVVLWLTACGDDDRSSTMPDAGVDAGEEDGGGDGERDAGSTTACTPGETRGCYTGPGPTVRVGICQSGTSTCGEAGEWGPCEDEVTPRSEDCSTPEDEDCDGAGPCPLPVEWMIDVGACATALSVGDDGLIAVAGTFAGARTILGTSMESAGSRDVFFGVVGGDGTPTWAHRIGGAPAESLAGVAFGGEDVVVAGTFSESITAAGTELTSAGGSDAFVVRVTAGGGVVADRQGGAEGDSFDRLVGDGIGLFLAGGSSAIDLGAGTLQGRFLAGLTPGGTLDWSQDMLPVLGAVAARDGAATMAGAFSTPFEFAGSTLTPEGWDIYVLRWTADGAAQLGRVVEAGYQYDVTVAAGPGGRYAIGGGYTAADVTFPGGPSPPAGTSGSDGFFGSFEPDGSLHVAGFLHESGEGVGVHESVTALAYDPAGRLYVAGRIDSAIVTPAGVLATATANNYADAVLLVYGDDGAFLYGQLFGERDPKDAAAAVATDASGGVYLSVCTDEVDGVLYRLVIP